jgi:hypothetical protein
VYGCELIFNRVEAEQVKAGVRAACGGECPCDRNERCPLLPDDLRPLVIPPATDLPLTA